MKQRKKALKRLAMRQAGMRATHANIKRRTSSIDPAKSYRMPGSMKK